MRKFLYLAFRNVFRNRRRTLLTLLVVGGGVVALLLAGGYFSYMFEQLREGTIRNGLGHLQVYNADYFRRDEPRVLGNGLDNWQSIASVVTRAPHVRGVAPRISFYGMISNGMKSAVFMGTAVDPEAERRMGFTPALTSGHDLQETASGEIPALIGTGVARSMNVKVGDGLTLLAVTADGALNGIDVKVAGIVNTGFKETDDRLVRIPLVDAQHLLQSQRITNLVVGLDSTGKTDETYAALTPLLAGGKQEVAIRKWIELATFYRQVKTMFDGIFFFLGVIVFFMVVMSSANTLMMAMFERTREIGTMLAMGTPRHWVIGLFLLEAVLTGVLGAAAGVVCGNLSGFLLNQANIKLPSPPGFTVNMYFHVLHEPNLMIGASLLVAFTLAVASIVPAVRASRLQIAEALAHV